MVFGGRISVVLSLGGPWKSRRIIKCKRVPSVLENLGGVNLEHITIYIIDGQWSILFYLNIILTILFYCID